jgi:hypothetical protein
MERLGKNFGDICIETIKKDGLSINVLLERSIVRCNQTYMLKAIHSKGLGLLALGLSGLVRLETTQQLGVVSVGKEKDF